MGVKASCLIEMLIDFFLIHFFTKWKDTALPHFVVVRCVNEACRHHGVDARCYGMT
jgi:hypothetical protein